MSVDGVFDAQSVGHFVEHGVGEEGIKGDVPSLLLCNQHFGNGDQDLVVLGLHGVFQLRAAGAVLLLEAFVVGQVDRNGLGARVAIAGVVNHIVSVELCVATDGVLLVLGVYGEFFLQARKQGLVALEALAPGHVFDQHVSFVRGLVVVEVILVVLNGTHDEVQYVAFHLQPRYI